MTDFAVAVPDEREEDVVPPEEAAVSTGLVPADRAEAPVSEVTERFLRAVIAKVPLERIEELHLFAPLRQGGVETGIAVVAARAPAPVVSVAVDEVSAASVEDIVPLEDATDVPAPDADPLTLEPAAEAAMPPEDMNTLGEAEDPATSDTDEDTLDPVMEAALHENDVDSPYADGDAVHVVVGAVESDAEAPAQIADTDVMEMPALPLAPMVRHTVYTARYRLVLKGPERGRWEAEVVDEADAPLLTVETVVRGVQRRAGEDTEILRYSERQIARALRMEWPVTTDVSAA